MKTERQIRNSELDRDLHLFRKGKKSAMSVFVDLEYFSVHARKYYQMFFADIIFNTFDH